MKKNRRILLAALICMIGVLAAGCGFNTDYTDYFSIVNISRMNDEIENRIEVEYEINNIGKKDNLVFCVTIDGMTEEYQVAPESKESDKIVINIGRPEVYQLSYPAIFEVKKNGDVIWSKEDTINYDCSEMFQHKATVKYRENTAEITLVDYQTNYFDLSELFPDFDVKAPHSIQLNNAANDCAAIQEKEDSETAAYLAANGAILRLTTYGTNEMNDTYHFSDNLEVVITYAILASSVKWENHMKFLEDAYYSTDSIAGISVTTYEMDVIVDNPSDEMIYGSVTKFYVNDKAVSDEYLAATEYRGILSGGTEKLYNISSPSVWETTGETNITKFGMKIKLEDSKGKVLYNDVLWLYLK